MQFLCKRSFWEVISIFYNDIQIRLKHIYGLYGNRELSKLKPLHIITKLFHPTFLFCSEKTKSKESEVTKITELIRDKIGAREIAQQ